MSKPIVIAKTGEAMPSVAERRGDYERWITAAFDVDLEVRVVAVFDGEVLPDPRQIAGLVVTGSPAMVSDREPWSERTAEWLSGALACGDDTPAILGICYGHQLLAHAQGGRVDKNPRGRQMGTKRVRFEPAGSDPLFGALADECDFHTTHLESVLELPRGAVRLASTELDPNHAFRIGDRVWGIQFHPEFDEDIMRGYVEGRAEVLRSEGRDPDAIARDVRPTAEAVPLLRRFGRIAASRAAR